MRLCYVLFNDFYITFITLVNTNVQSAAIYSYKNTNENSWENPRYSVGYQIGVKIPYFYNCLGVEVIKEKK